MRVFTCTPVDFGGGVDFFARDSGLLCRGFQTIGIQSQAIMPGTPRQGDEAGLIRTEFPNLESAEWWKSHQLDGVVLYAWGRPKFRKVAAAIHKAGIFLVLNQDNGGLVSPLAGFTGWLREQWNLSGQGRGLPAWIRFLKTVVRGLSIGLLVTDPLRANHLRQGDIIACVSPKAAEHYLKLCRIYGGPRLADRVRVIPHAVEAKFHYTHEIKIKRVVCVGRWDDAVQKRPHLLIDTLNWLLDADDIVEISIVGKQSSEIEKWHNSLPEVQQARVSLRGFMNRDELADLLVHSQVFYSPSAFESFGIAAAEALCSGCSVVAGHSVSLASFEWFVSENSGTLAKSDDCIAHAAALRNELKLWTQRGRDGQTISHVWCGQLHADRVATRLVEMIRTQ